MDFPGRRWPGIVNTGKGNCHFWHELPDCTASIPEIGYGSDPVGHAVTKVGQLDYLVGHAVPKVGQNRHLGETESPIEGAQSESGRIQGQNWRTPEKDEIVKQMGQKMNEMSSDLMDQFVIDEKWLQFLTKDEYNHLVKISDDLNKNRT